MNPESYESTFFLALRRMRAPLITLIVIYAVSILGLTLIPGLDAEGNPSQMDFLHAYFISYTATTIGFGEIPNAFPKRNGCGSRCAFICRSLAGPTRLARCWPCCRIRISAMQCVCNALAGPCGICGNRFTWSAAMAKPGSCSAALDQLGVRAIVIEVSESRVSQLDLHGHTADIPALAADASQPEILKLAGLTHRAAARA